VGVQFEFLNLVRTAGRQGPLFVLSLGLLIGCVPPVQSVEASSRQRTPRSEAQPQPRSPYRAPYRSGADAPAAASRVPPAVASAQATLEARLKSLGRSFNGKAGIAVRDLQTGWSTAYNGNEYFPQQSVSKFWVALAALDKVDRGALNLSKPVVVRREDLTLFHQPIAGLVKSNGYTTTLRDLMNRALTQSDNTANDFILRRAGGPEAVRAFLKRHDIDGVRFGPGERLLQSQTAGLTWRQEYSIANGFERARANLPTAVRRAAFERYLANPIDGATPAGLVDGLAKLHQGKLLSPASTQHLLSTMSNTKTGAQRLKGGLKPGWKCAHKTGTGQNFNSTVAGYNDVGILTAPDGRAYAIAVMIGRTEVGIPTRQKLMNDAVRAVIDYQENMGGD
jgi:beta-lactamase class A